MGPPLGGPHSTPAYNKIGLDRLLISCVLVCTGGLSHYNIMYKEGWEG